MLRIAFEGMDGSGKSTQVQMFLDNLSKTESDKSVKLYHEPRVLREKIFEETKKPGVNDADISYMFAVDGALCREEEIKENYDIIIRDRDTTLSQYAYHHGLGTSDQMIKSMAYLLNTLNGVDLVFFVDIPIDISLGRIKARAPEKAIVDYFEKEEKLRKIYTNYQQLFSDTTLLNEMGMKINKTLIIKIDGNDTIENVHSKIMKVYEDYENKKL